MKRLVMALLFTASPIYGQTFTNQTRSVPSQPPVDAPLVDAPSHFVFVMDGVQVRQDIGECAHKLTDEKSAASLLISVSHVATRKAMQGDTTVTTVTAYADYFVTPAGAYGVSEDELARVDCATNSPVGKVKRSASQ